MMKKVASLTTLPSFRRLRQARGALMVGEAVPEAILKFFSEEVAA